MEKYSSDVENPAKKNIKSSKEEPKSTLHRFFRFLYTLAGVTTLSAPPASLITLLGMVAHSVIGSKKILSAENPGKELIELYEKPSFFYKMTTLNTLAAMSVLELLEKKEKFREAFLYIVQENRPKIVEDIAEHIDETINGKLDFSTINVIEYIEIFQEAKELAEKQNNTKNTELVNILSTEIKLLGLQKTKHRNMFEENIEIFKKKYNPKQDLTPFASEYVELSKEHWTDKEILEFVKSPQYKKLKNLIKEPQKMKPLTEKELNKLAHKNDRTIG